MNTSKEQARRIRQAEGVDSKGYLEMQLGIKKDQLNIVKRREESIQAEIDHITTKLEDLVVTTE